jgi:cold shock protein
MTTQQGETGGDVGTVELRGKVKWFNAVKGYGFLALDADNSDAFLHVTTLRQAGHEDLKPGATVVCAGVRGPKGWQVMKVLDVDSSTAIATAPKPPPVPDGIAMGDYIAAPVKWYNNERGYGFVTRGDRRRHLRACRGAASPRHGIAGARPEGDDPHRRGPKGAAGRRDQGGLVAFLLSEAGEVPAKRAEGS